MVRVIHPQIKAETPKAQTSEIERRHFSVGAIPVRYVNGTVEVLVHYFSRLPPMPVYSEERIALENVYKLMTETPEEKENSSKTLYRGLKEELGVLGGKILDTSYQLVTVMPWYDRNIRRSFVTEKTSKYYVVEGVELSGVREENTLESLSTPTWVEITALIANMQEQHQRYPQIPETDESSVLIEALPFLSSKAREEQIFLRLAETLKNS